MHVKAWKNFIRQKERSIGGGYRAIDDRREFNEYIHSLRGGAEYELGTYDQGTKTITVTRTVNDLKEMQGNEYIKQNGEWRDYDGSKVEVDVAPEETPFKDHSPFVTFKSNDGNYYLITNINDGGKSAQGVQLSEAPTMDAKSANFVKGIPVFGDNEANLPDPKQDVGFRLDYRNPNFTIGGYVLKDMAGYENREAALIATMNRSGGIFGNSGNMNTGGSTPVWLAWPTQFKVSKDKEGKDIALGVPGKEGKTFQVLLDDGRIAAMKTFHVENKSSATIKKEAELQQKAADRGISPAVIDVQTSTTPKYILMEKLEKRVVDHYGRGDTLSPMHQDQLIEHMKHLDEINILHDDGNVLNLMLDDKDNLKLIDFDLAREFTAEDVKLGKSNGSITLFMMDLGLKRKGIKSGERVKNYIKTKTKERQSKRKKEKWFTW